MYTSAKQVKVETCYFMLGTESSVTLLYYMIAQRISTWNSTKNFYNEMK
jgi:hypothetical protein